jgi:hypothetical protein
MIKKYPFYLIKKVFKNITLPQLLPLRPPAVFFGIKDPSRFSIFAGLI